MDDLRSTIEAVFRRESGRVIASLIRLARSFDLAEEAMQDAFTAALLHWETDGIPENPAAWITRVAQRKLVDYTRREQFRRAKEDQVRYETKWSESSLAETDAAHDPAQDDRLRLIFTCCHPALNVEAQTALTLRTLGGLTTAEIARAFLLPESTLAQRLVRAKRKIQKARIPYQVPAANALPERLSAVRTVLYLIYNEGYTASSGDSLIRRELCNEAISLARTLCELMPGEAENFGLLGLMLLHDSRRDTRVSGTGELITLDQQDRTRWNEAKICEGLRVLESGLRLHSIGPYQLQAAIAAVHAEAKTSDETDWKQIAALYQKLAAIHPSAVVALNHAVAVAMAEGPESGLRLMDSVEISGVLNGYYLFHAARADLLRRLKRNRESLTAYEAALSLTGNDVERRYLRRRMDEVSSAPA